MLEAPQTKPDDSGSSSSPIKNLSLRDPGGKLFDVDGRLIRLVQTDFLPHLDAMLASPTIAKATSENKFVASVRLSATDSVRQRLSQAGNPRIDCLLEHRRVAFTSFPHEWTAEMLFAAAHLTLDLAEALLPEGLGLKDATPYNILFEGANPVFVDVLSVEKRTPGDPLWLPYAQFAQTFLNPLLANKYFGIPVGSHFLSHREGMKPEELYPFCGTLRRWTPPFLGLVTIPALLNKKSNAPAKAPRKVLMDEEKARFILSMTFKRLRKNLNRLAPTPKKSFWFGYMSQTLLPYSQDQLAEKEKFVKEVLNTTVPKSVLDVGCNTGHFSLLSAKAGARVTAIDFDPVVVGKTWALAKETNTNILPLVVNLAHPTPALGWRNQETKSFLDRSQGKSDLVLMLAVLHHLVVTEGIPVSEVVKVAASLTSKDLVLEFVPPSDPMFQSLARGRDYSYFTEEFLTQELSRFFRIEKQARINNSDRRLFWLRKLG